jgi:hypothetical protein
MRDTGFATLPPSVWVLADSIAPDRRKKLVEAPAFESIVDGLGKCARIHSCKRSRQNRSPTPWPKRAVVVLAFPGGEHWVDLFHNATTGIRAQCLYDVELGSLALDYARDALRERALELLENHRMTASLRSFAALSLRDDSTKVWIHQGLWVRHARTDVRELLVSQWQCASPRAEGEAKLLRYGSKAPESPPQIDVLGGLFDENLHGCESKKQAGDRPLQVSRFGFT